MLYPVSIMEKPLITPDCMTALCYEIDEPRCAIPQHPEAHLWPREVSVTGMKSAALQHLCHQRGSLAFSSSLAP